MTKSVTLSNSTEHLMESQRAGRTYRITVSLPLGYDAPAGDDWPFNDPGYQLTPMLNLAVAGSGGGDPTGGTYPADMLVDWVRVW